MTENEAITVLKMVEAHGCLVIEAKVKAIQALEEIQQYRAIGTVEEFKAFKLGRLGNKGFITIGQTMEEYAQEIREKVIDECIKIIEETVWKDTDMLVESIRELKGGANNG